jgi:hypothetical protein
MKHLKIQDVLTSLNHRFHLAIYVKFNSWLEMSQSYLKMTEWQVTAINPDNYLRKTRPKRPKKAKNFENYQSTNIVEKSMKKYSKSFGIYLYKLQQYSNSSDVKKKGGWIIII